MQKQFLDTSTKSPVAFDNLSRKYLITEEHAVKRFSEDGALEQSVNIFGHSFRFIPPTDKSGKNEKDGKYEPANYHTPETLRFCPALSSRRIKISHSGIF